MERWQKRVWSKWIPSPRRCSESFDEILFIFILSQMREREKLLERVKYDVKKFYSDW